MQESLRRVIPGIQKEKGNFIICVETDKSALNYSAFTGGDRAELELELADL